jgi:hypothetical protein
VIAARVTLASAVAIGLVLAISPSAQRSSPRFLERAPAAIARVVSPRPATAAGEVDVSRATLAQAEAAVAVDPRDASVLVAASNSQAPSLQVYTSVDGGAAWTSSPLPPPAGLCAFGDPAPAIGPDSRQYVGFLAGRCAGSGNDATVALATREGVDAPWSSHSLDVPGEQGQNDKDALAVDARPSSPWRGRVYAAWSRFVRASNTHEAVISHSDDHGETWSRAVKVSPAHAVTETFASIAVGPAGEVYVAWLTGDGRIELAASRDGEHFGSPLVVAVSLDLAPDRCDFAGSRMAAQPRRCVTPSPLVAVDPSRGRLYVTYSAAADSRRAQNVYATAYSVSPLRRLGRARRVNPPDGRVASDQFLPTAAVDEATGRLWVCWYDTRGDASRERVRYTCSASSNGGRTWATPVAAATLPSNETVEGATRFGYGDYAGLAAAGGIAHPVWTDSRDLRPLAEEIYTRQLRRR